MRSAVRLELSSIPQILPLFPSALASEYGVRALGIITDPNLIAVTAFAVIGLVMAIGFAAFLPLPDDLAALR